MKKNHLFSLCISVLLLLSGCTSKTAPITKEEVDSNNSAKYTLEIVSSANNAFIDYENVEISVTYADRPNEAPIYQGTIASLYSKMKNKLKVDMKTEVKIEYKNKTGGVYWSGNDLANLEDEKRTSKDVVVEMNKPKKVYMFVSDKSIELVNLTVAPDSSRATLKLNDQIFRVMTTIKVPKGFVFEMVVTPSYKCYFSEWESSNVEIKDKYNYKKQNMTIVDSGKIKPLLADGDYFKLLMTDGGSVKLDNTTYTKSENINIERKGYEIEAIANSGYKFVRWEYENINNIDIYQAKQNVNLSYNSELYAIFAKEVKLNINISGEGYLMIDGIRYDKSTQINTTVGEHKIEAIASSKKWNYSYTGGKYYSGYALYKLTSSTIKIENIEEQDVVISKTSDISADFKQTFIFQCYIYNDYRSSSYLSEPIYSYITIDDGSSTSYSITNVIPMGEYINGVVKVMFVNAPVTLFCDVRYNLVFETKNTPLGGSIGAPASSPEQQIEWNVPKQDEKHNPLIYGIKLKSGNNYYFPNPSTYIRWE